MPYEITGKFAVRFVPRDDAREFDISRYQPELVAMTKVMACALQASECDPSMEGKARPVTFSLAVNPEINLVSISVSCKLFWRERIAGIIERITRRPKQDNLIGRAMKALGIQHSDEDMERALAGYGFIDAKLRLIGREDFSLAIGSSVNEIILSDSSEKIKLLRESAQMFMNKNAHLSFRQFMAPLRCGALDCVEIENSNGSCITRLYPDDSRAFDVGDMEFYRVQ